MAPKLSLKHTKEHLAPQCKDKLLEESFGSLNVQDRPGVENTALCPHFPGGRKSQARSLLKRAVLRLWSVCVCEGYCVTTILEAACWVGHRVNDMVTSVPEDVR